MLTIKTWTRGAETIPAIDGRELHKALGVGRDFPTWVNTRLQYGYIENEDFTTYLVPRGSGTPAKEYLLTLPMASELCLLDRSAEGLELRRFILEMQSVQNHQNSEKIIENCTDNKPMELLTLSDLESFRTDTLKACTKCLTPHKNEGTLCQACNHFDEVQEQKADLVRQRNQLNVTENVFVQCLIEREGDTTMTAPGAFGTIITFRRNQYGHAVAKIENPVHRANILKSIFYRSYTPPDQEAA